MRLCCRSRWCSVAVTEGCSRLFSRRYSGCLLIRSCSSAAGGDPYDANATAADELVSFTSCFHGRTMGSLALTYKAQYKTPFLPMIGGTQIVPWLDFDAVSSAIKKASPCSTAPVQDIATHQDGFATLRCFEIKSTLIRSCCARSWIMFARAC